MNNDRIPLSDEFEDERDNYEDLQYYEKEEVSEDFTELDFDDHEEPSEYTGFDDDPWDDREGDE